MTKIINLTPHKLVWGEQVFEASLDPAEIYENEWAGIDMSCPAYTELFATTHDIRVHLPEEFLDEFYNDPETIFIVEMKVAGMLKAMGSKATFVYPADYFTDDLARVHTITVFKWALAT
jgi:hypothetical protein